jgi:GT2 family glycosyltransferase
MGLISQTDSVAPGISIVVVTHESVEDIETALTSLRDDGPNDSYEIIVVDNASIDGTADLVAARHPAARLIRSSERRGFAANCNRGVAVARGQRLVFFNPDARTRPGALDLLLDYLADHPDVGIVAPALVYPDGSPQPSARRFPRFTTTVIRRTPLRLLFPNSARERRHLMQDANLDAAIEVDWVLGAAFVMTKDTFDRLGGFDEGYRLYCEDIDLCWRTWDAGLQVVYLPQAVVEHGLSELTRRVFFTRATVWHFLGMARFLTHHGFRPPSGRAASEGEGGTAGMPS